MTTRQQQIDYITRMIGLDEVSDAWILEQTKIATTLPESEAPTLEDRATTVASGQLRREAMLTRTKEIVEGAKEDLPQNPTSNQLIAAAEALEEKSSMPVPEIPYTVGKVESSDEPEPKPVKQTFIQRLISG